MKQEWLQEHPIGTVLGDPMPGAPELAARGETVMGVRTLKLLMPDQKNVLEGLTDGKYPVYHRPLTVETWYPACPAEKDAHAVYTDFLGRVDLGNLQPYTIPGRAFRDAAPDAAAGARPVVVISHGYPGSRMLLVNLAENLASKGYIVFSIGHTDNTYEDFPAKYALESALIHRSLDQRFVVQELKHINEETFLRGMLQTDNVGVIGFSMGGYGLLRTLGARFSDKALATFAPFAHELQEAEDYTGLTEVKAAVLFAPATFWLDPAKTRGMDVPTLWFCGTSDRTVHYGMVRDFWEKSVHSDRYLISYENCGHNIANNPPPHEAQSASWEIYKRWADPVWDTWHLNNLNAHFTTAFLDCVLRGSSEHGRYLQVPVERGSEAVWSLDADGRAKTDHTGWPGFADNGAAGIRLEHRSAE